MVCKMAFLSYCVLTIVFVLLLLLIRSVKGEFALPLSVCISVALAGVALAAATPLLDYINNLAKPYTGEYLPLMLKAVGISLVTSTSADICRDSGENAIASKVELLGKCEILALSLPLLTAMAELITEVLGL